MAARSMPRRPAPTTTPTSAALAWDSMERASSNVQKWWMPSASVFSMPKLDRLVGVPPVAIRRRS